VLALPRSERPGARRDRGKIRSGAFGTIAFDANAGRVKPFDFLT
jgi:hypothetical protein